MHDDQFGLSRKRDGKRTGKSLLARFGEIRGKKNRVNKRHDISRLAHDLAPSRASPDKLKSKIVSLD
jgi:hypothetical protein